MSQKWKYHRDPWLDAEEDPEKNTKGQAKVGYENASEPPSFEMAQTSRLLFYSNEISANLASTSASQPYASTS